MRSNGSRLSDTVSVLYVDHAEALGGAEYSLLEILNNLRRQRFRPVLACQSAELAEAARRAEVEIYEISMPVLRGCRLAPFRLLKGSMALARVVRRAGCDIIHTNTMRGSFYAAGASLLTRVPLVWHVRDFYQEPWYPKLLCRISAETVAVSKAAADQLPSNCRATVIHNGLNPKTSGSDLKKAGFRSGLSIPAESPLIGSVGRLRPWKGQDLLLRTVPLVTGRFPESRFLLVGGTIFSPPSNFEEKLHSLAAALEISENVLFLGHRQDVASIMANLDLLVHTAVEEPFGRVLIEAMSMSVPVVAFEGGAVEEIVLHEKSGLIVPRGDIRKLGEAIISLIEQPELREEMGRQARKRVVEFFDSSRLTRQLEERYLALLEERDARRF